MRERQEKRPGHGRRAEDLLQDHRTWRESARGRVGTIPRDHGDRRAETPFTQQLRIPHMTTTTARYRNLYAKLLRLYPKPYRERFGEEMEQTFNDICRE